MTLFSATLLLLLVIDPIGNIPVFLTTLQGVPARRHRPIIVRELLIALGVLVLFMFSGRTLLEVLQISEPSLTVAGGVLLFLIALRMVFPRGEGVYDLTVKGEPFIVPLAIPFVAGPSAMASVLLISSSEPDRRLEWLLALFLAWAITGTTLYLASDLRRILGDRVLTAVERLMGMILVAISVQMLMTGIAKFLRSVPV
jgi:MarC family membrane protein